MARFTYIARGTVDNPDVCVCVCDLILEQLVGSSITLAAKVEEIWQALIRHNDRMMSQNQK